VDPLAITNMWINCLMPKASVNWSGKAAPCQEFLLSPIKFTVPYLFDLATEGFHRRGITSQQPRQIESAK
jgi:hypothetical protein